MEAPDPPQERPISNAKNKIIMITGATSGIGKATLEALVTHNPTHVYLLSRNVKEGVAEVQKLQRIVPDVLMSFIICDLSNFASIRKAVADFSLFTTRLDILICNSGVCMVPPGLTADGYEIHMGINHVGHALLIKLLLPILLHTTTLPPGDVRIIIVSSSSHTWAPTGGIIFTDLKTTQATLTSKQRYGQSKLANIMYARELANRYPSITTMSIHPGCVDTNIVQHLKKKYLHSDMLIRRVWPVFNAIYRGFGKEMLTPEQGARVSVWCASAPASELTNGEYYGPGGVLTERSAYVGDPSLSADLWMWTQTIVTSIPFSENSTEQ